MNRRPGPESPAFFTRAHRVDHRPEINPYRDLIAEFGEELISSELAPTLRERWAERFAAPAPLWLELGVGNGSWLPEQALARPDAHWLGIEIRYKRCVQAAAKIRKAGAKNAKIVRYSWFSLHELFAPRSLAGIVIQHPDPWEKGGEAKHRLIDPLFLNTAAGLLTAGGELWLKTDFRPHFDALLRCTDDQRFRVVGTSLDILHAGAPWPNDIITGYQSKFNRRGLPVFAARLVRTDSPPHAPE